MPDVEKALEVLTLLQKGLAPPQNTPMPACRWLVDQALSALTDDKEPEPEVWKILPLTCGVYGTAPHARVVGVVDGHDIAITDWLPEGHAKRIASLPILERSHEALKSAAKRVVEVNAAVQGCAHYSFAYAKARTELNSAVNELSALVED